MHSNKRLYYLDWLRVFAFGLLFLFHSWRPFDHFPWHIKNEEQIAFFDMLTMFTHGWRMFLIFLVSGAGTWLAMRSRKGKFVIDRIKRLIVPFLFGILLIIPPQRFYEWIMFRDFQGAYFDFLLLYPAQQLGSNMGASVLLWFGHLGTHLWYLPFLFVMTLISLPIFKKIQKGQINFTGLKKIMSNNFGVFILVLPMIVCRLILKPVFQEYTDWADFFVYIWPFIYGFIFMADKEFLDIIKSKMVLFLNVGILSSALFIYLGSTGEQFVQAYLNPSYSWLHVTTSINAMIIAISWIMFFLALFARKMNFNHSVLIPANISILPIYVLHQTLIIVFGYYIVGLEISPYTKFLMIALTAIPASVILYQLIKTNNFTRFLFGLKPKAKVKKQRASEKLVPAIVQNQIKQTK
ncbi:acyltransferase family protein [Labilibaculum sp. DW002]|uniref:Acyltransferase family protein n=1 Tax=Paralabilibaculum antarcticum TaxID=2912572 RepID=A0ABT5VX56_9BACT|nr:acyltransferase family protein [Labilibaculum sp. DW002]MDE5419996.1 acyltransferase family protein [Labilibaculum sp. DW002]